MVFVPFQSALAGFLVKIDSPIGYAHASISQSILVSRAIDMQDMDFEPCNSCCDESQCASAGAFINQSINTIASIKNNAIIF